jgi:hypothetical protein
MSESRGSLTLFVADVRSENIIEMHAPDMAGSRK